MTRSQRIRRGMHRLGLALSVPLMLCVVFNVGLVVVEFNNHGGPGATTDQKSVSYADDLFGLNKAQPSRIDRRQEIISDGSYVATILLALAIAAYVIPWAIGWIIAGFLDP